MLTLRRTSVALIGILGILGSVLLGAGVSQGQTQPYPPGTGTTTCIHGSTIDAGTVAIGQTATFLLCGPFASAPVVVTVDGTVTFTNKSPVNGAVTVVVTRISATALSVDDPVNVASVCGTNTVTATGPGIPSGTASASGVFTIQCAATTPAAGGLAFTGANVILALVVAMALIALGVLLVLFQRRRRQGI